MVTSHIPDTHMCYVGQPSFNTTLPQMGGFFGADRMPSGPEERTRPSLERVCCPGSPSGCCPRPPDTSFPPARCLVNGMTHISKERSGPDRRVRCGERKLFHQSLSGPNRSAMESDPACPSRPSFSQHFDLSVVSERPVFRVDRKDSGFGAHR